MKRIILAVMAVFTIGAGSGSATAQQKVIPAQIPSVTVTGNIKAAGWTSDTASATVSSALFPLYSGLDTVTTTAGVRDSGWFKISGELNSVGIEIHATKVSGRVDSTTFYIMGTMSNRSGAVYSTLTSFTMANNTYEQVFPYIINTTGGGNKYTHLKVVARCTNATPGTNSVQYSYWVLPR